MAGSLTGLIFCRGDVIAGRKYTVRDFCTKLSGGTAVETFVERRKKKGRDRGPFVRPKQAQLTFMSTLRGFTSAVFGSDKCRTPSSYRASTLDSSTSEPNRSDRTNFP